MLNKITPELCLVCIRFWAADKNEYKRRLYPLVSKLLARGFQPAVAINHEKGRDCGSTLHWIKEDFGRAVIAEEFRPWSGGMMPLGWFTQVALQEHLQATALMSCDVDPVCPNTNGEGRIEHLLSVFDADPMAVVVGATFRMQRPPQSDGIYPWRYDFCVRNTLAVWRTQCLALTGVPPTVCGSRNVEYHGMEEVTKFRTVVHLPQFHFGRAHLIELPGGPIEIDMSNWDEARRVKYLKKVEPGEIEDQMFQRQIRALSAFGLSHPELTYFGSVNRAISALFSEQRALDQRWTATLEGALPVKLLN